MKSQQKFILELYEESDSVNFYTIRFDGEKDTEFDKFIIGFIERKEFEKELEKITRWIDNIGERGALERYFRPESKISDGVNAIPVEVSTLRLYCLRISDQVLVLGNGGHKPHTQHKYNTDPHLSSCVEILAHLDTYIKARIAQGKITISGKTISGDLSFYYKTK